MFKFRVDLCSRCAHCDKKYALADDGKRTAKEGKRVMRRISYLCMLIDIQAGLKICKKPLESGFLCIYLVIV